MIEVAALFVEASGPYSGLPGVDLWPVDRDARLYRGSAPVVAHPPCLRWCVMSNCTRRRDGQDDGCFEAALVTVRRVGGVIEHPAHSLAWPWFGLRRPPIDGGWVWADFEGGWTCHVDQGRYGFKFRKPTWLYAVGVDLPSLLWGDSGRPRGVSSGVSNWDGGSVRRRSCTPEPFRDVLLAAARTVAPERLQRRDPAFAGARGVKR